MDFSNRSAQPQPTPSVQSGATGSSNINKKRAQNRSQWTRWINFVLVAAVIILLIGLTVFIGFGNNTPNEGKYVDSTKLQAVFLNTGQVYFGNIKSLNKSFVVLTNIYYLQTSGGSSSSSTSNPNVTLVKLGCELHRPFDQMVINRQQVTFWENLQSDGQVAKAVKTFQQQNPQGQKCADQSSSASPTSGNSAQGASNSTTPSASPTTPSKP